MYLVEIVELEEGRRIQSRTDIEYSETDLFWTNYSIHKREAFEMLSRTHTHSM